MGDVGQPAPAGVVGQTMTDDKTKHWYIIHTYSGFENKVKESLEQRVQAYGLQDEIGEILIPTEDIIEKRGGREVKSSRRFFPGYILVEMHMSDHAWHVVKNTPKVTGFVGAGPKPSPLSREEGRLRALEIARRDRLDEARGGLDARADLVEGLLGVRVLRRLLAREARRGELRGVARGLDLAHERVLIRREAGRQEHVGIERLGLRVRGRLVDDAGEVGEQALVDGDGELIGGNGHGIGPG